MLLRRAGLILALQAAALTADIRDCTGISTDGYKIVLDNLSIVGPGTDTARQLFTHLREKVQFDLQATQLETTPQMVLVPCRNRTPEDVTDFNPTIVDSLNGQRVLLEIWGQIEARTGVSVQRAQLNFMLVPISFYDRTVIPAGGFSAAYQQRLRGTPEELAKIFGEFSALKTYVSIAAGVKSLKEHAYDQAYVCFCRAGSLLALPPSDIEPAIRTSLLRYVAQKVNDAFNLAQNDKSAPSRLALQGARSQCPGALP
jgi:hypothetical protein